MKPVNSGEKTYLEQFLGLDITDILKTLGLAASPISELRGAIPLAVLEFDFPWYYAYIIAALGNMLPVPFILLFLNAVTRILSRIPLFDRFFKWLFAYTRRRGTLIEKYERIGLILFVAIPLPVTGAWTGSIVAVLLGMKFTRAILSIFLGVLIAGAIVTCLTLLGWVGAVIAGIVLCVFAAVGVWRL